MCACACACACAWWVPDTTAVCDNINRYYRNAFYHETVHTFHGRTALSRRADSAVGWLPLRMGSSCHFYHTSEYVPIVAGAVYIRRVILVADNESSWVVSIQ